MLLSCLLEEVAPKSVQGRIDVDVTHVSHDSRAVNHDGIFVAIVGANVDGRKFAKNLDCVAVFAETEVEVMEGVTTVLVEDARQALAHISAALAKYPCQELTMIGITGTNGKTTTAWLLEHIARSAGLSVGVIGTLGHRLNGVNEKKQDGRTTPEASTLQPLLRTWKEVGCQWVIMEASSIGLTLKRLTNIQFDVAAWTNFTQDHLDFHENMEDYFNAKAALFSDHLKQNAISILNQSDPHISEIKPSLGRVWQFGLKTETDIQATQIRMSPKGIECLINAHEQSGTLFLPLIGNYNLENALTAIGCALGAGLDLTTILKALSILPQTPGRMERIDNHRNLAVFVDYAHTPDALKRALNSLKPICSGRLMVIIGCGGDRDPSKRAEMGHIAQTHADLSFITSDNPRSEEPQSITNDILSGMKKAHYSHTDRKKTINKAISEMQRDDILLIAGKGHEEYQELDTITLRFSDKEEALSAIGENQ